MTKTEILNLALARVGSDGINASFADSSSGQAALAVWNAAVMLCLSSYPWSFALRQFELARSHSTAIRRLPGRGSLYCYLIPSDSIRIHRAYSLDGNDIDYIVAENYIWSETDGIIVEYISKDIQNFPEYFSDCLAWKIAMEISPYVSQGGENIQKYVQLFEQALDRGKVENDAQFPISLTKETVWQSNILHERFAY